jgi:hypothetical protein
MHFLRTRATESVRLEFAGFTVIYDRSTRGTSLELVRSVFRHLRFSRRISAIVSALILAAAAVSTAGVPPDDKPGAPAVVVQHVPGPETGVRDETTMVLVGAALIALGAAVRRTA